MPTHEPKNLDEFNDRWKHNYKAEGFGFEGVTLHWPCPMCAAPDWHVGLLMGLYGGVPDTACDACGRTSRIEVEHTPTVTTTRNVFVEGPAPPKWMADMRPRPFHEAGGVRQPPAVDEIV